MFDRLSLEHVSKRSRSAMNVDVIHLLGSELRVAHRVQHDAIPALTFFARLGDVIGVGTPAVTNHFRHDRGSAPPGEFQLFENQNSRAFADDEAITVNVERTTCLFGTIIAGRESAHGSESTDTHGSDRSFGS